MCLVEAVQRAGNTGLAVVSEERALVEVPRADQDWRLAGSSLAHHLSKVSLVRRRRGHVEEPLVRSPWGKLHVHGPIELGHLQSAEIHVDLAAAGLLHVEEERASISGLVHAEHHRLVSEPVHLELRVGVCNVIEVHVRELEGSLARRKAVHVTQVQVLEEDNRVARHEGEEEHHPEHRPEQEGEAEHTTVDPSGPGLGHRGRDGLWDGRRRGLAAAIRGDGDVQRSFHLFGWRGTHR
mmetsp:Transcript_21112/g.61630  ORF Transcript_21112/g.61630 Transcript_21112/m.61630 type:complete len:238 (+) Transcript_21112:363-1076(+)